MHDFCFLRVGVNPKVGASCGEFVHFVLQKVRGLLVMNLRDSPHSTATFTLNLVVKTKSHSIMNRTLKVHY